MSLDDRIVAIYRALDSVTLLALLPALRYEVERTEEEADAFDRVRQAIPAQTAAVAELLMGETGMPRDRPSGEPLALEQHEHAAPAGDRPASGGELGNILTRLDRYREDLAARERWIRSEIIRRGLLPEYPFWGPTLTRPD